MNDTAELPVNSVRIAVSLQSNCDLIKSTHNHTYVYVHYIRVYRMHFCMTQGPQGVQRTQIEANVMRSPPNHGPTLRHLATLSECQRNLNAANAIKINLD